jgi:hypothetical protein
MKERRVRVVRRLVERPKTVYERFPAFEQDKILDFSELFKGYTVKKSRISKRPFNGASRPSVFFHRFESNVRQLRPGILGAEKFRATFSIPSLATRNASKRATMRRERSLLQAWTMICHKHYMYVPIFTDFRVTSPTAV